MAASLLSLLCSSFSLDTARNARVLTGIPPSPSGCIPFSSGRSTNRPSRILATSSWNGVAGGIDREAAARDLLEWMASKGVAEPGGVEVRRGELGLGLFAKRSVSKNQEVVSIPKTLWMDADTVRRSEIGECCEGLRPWIAVALYLLHEKAKPHSDWSAYIRVLPRTLDSPLFWSEEELAELKGTQLLSSMNGFKEFLKREYDKVMTEVIEPRPDVFDRSLYTLEAFTWAFGILRSRTFPPLIGDNLALVPLADFVNHGFGLTNEDPGWKVKSAGVFARQETLTLQAAANCAEKQEVLIQYGKKKGNAQLATDYGFVDSDEKNNRDSFTLTLQVSLSERFADDKVDIAQMAGLDSTAYFNLYRNQGPPEDMIAYLRLIALFGSDSFLLEALFRNTVWDHLRLPISRENEEAICEAMIEGCRATLREYSSTIDEDTMLLNSSELSTRKKMAVVVRLGEKRILQEQLQWFETHLADLDRLEFYAERRLRDLGLLDDKGNMTPWVFKS
ncbi:fructose-bisphosphate aldolase-lysine N-methyltransferase, chloroplastic [Selaginella moellendorffii]|uniref:fructose-bisphosphate aldolase-lysine N-methyltransferase, chloroplastic n=1 Tax=Selaginella moellendorffii TaxID=88036 RepID=UPI000D1CF338|nr:fructose-bisphosphate aldolase-lysine N-methyltransferase, chloroplastic [Selaginella moellendorffii]|eukprot:XP_002983944.2 fructose-bisphosphate aldolase-lysine N-methyltransferase, chloroplastic [Selaginella moellendorffii]